MLLQLTRDEHGLPLDAMYSVTDNQLGTINCYLRNISCSAEIIKIAREDGNWDMVTEYASHIISDVERILKKEEEITKEEEVLQ